MNASTPFFEPAGIIPWAGDIPAGMTVGELAGFLYPGQAFDAALPQSFVDYCERRGFDPRGHVVMLYSERMACGLLVPLTLNAVYGVPREMVQDTWDHLR